MNTREAALQSNNLPKPMAIAARPISPPFLMWGFWDMAKSDPRTLEEYFDFLVPKILKLTFFLFICSRLPQTFDNTNIVLLSLMCKTAI